jgi:hypothetical protein
LFSAQYNQRQLPWGASRPRQRHPTVFIGLAFLGIFFRVAALSLTVYGVGNGLAIEGNPVFYMFAPSEFVLLTFASLIIIYLLVWALPMHGALRITLASIVTFASAFDFLHDAFLLYYHQDIFQFLLHWFLHPSW